MHVGIESIFGSERVMVMAMVMVIGIGIGICMGAHGVERTELSNLSWV